MDQGRMTGDPEKHAAEFREAFQQLRTEMEKVLVGQSEAVLGVLTAFFAEGHALLEGAPGLGKTALVRALAGAAGLNDAVLQRRWPCRFLLTWRRLASSDSGIRTKERSE